MADRLSVVHRLTKISEWYLARALRYQAMAAVTAKGPATTQQEYDELAAHCDVLIENMKETDEQIDAETTSMGMSDKEKH